MLSLTTRLCDGGLKAAVLTEEDVTQAETVLDSNGASQEKTQVDSSKQEASDPALVGAMLRGEKSALGYEKTGGKDGAAKYKTNAETGKLEPI